MTARNEQTEDRLPPCSIEAEQGLLGCCLLGLDGDAVAEAIHQFGGGATAGSSGGSGERRNAQRERWSDEEVPLFFDGRHQQIWDALVRLWEDRKPVEVIMVAEMLRATGALEAVGGIPYLAALPDCAPAGESMVGWYAEVVREKWQLRRMLRVLTRSARRIWCPEEEEQAGRKRGASELLDEIEGEVMKANGGQGARAAEHIKGSCLRIMEKLESYQRGVGLMMGLRTHFGYFDKMTGGLHPGEMVVLAGRPSCGKTSLVMNLVENVAADGHGVGVFSMEMGTDDLVMRLLCSKSGADMQRVRTGYAQKGDFERIAGVMPEVAGLPVWFDDTPCLDIMELRARARRMHGQHGLKMVAVDYLQLGSAAAALKNGGSREREVSAFSSGCKALAKELHIPVVVLSQLNREAAKARRAPDLSDLRESGAIEQDADLVGLLWREEMDENEELAAEASGDWPVNLRVAKQRNGPTGDCEMVFNKPRMRFRDKWENRGKRD